jgi:hypothetical protein
MTLKALKDKGEKHASQIVSKQNSNVRSFAYLKMITVMLLRERERKRTMSYTFSDKQSKVKALLMI